MNQKTYILQLERNDTLKILLALMFCLDGLKEKCNNCLSILNSLTGKTSGLRLKGSIPKLAMSRCRSVLVVQLDKILANGIQKKCSALG